MIHSIRLNNDHFPIPVVCAHTPLLPPPFPNRRQFSLLRRVIGHPTPMSTLPLSLFLSLTSVRGKVSSTLPTHPQILPSFFSTSLDFDLPYPFLLLISLPNPLWIYVVYFSDLSSLYITFSVQISTILRTSKISYILISWLEQKPYLVHQFVFVSFAASQKIGMRFSHFLTQKKH